jgi:pimeloyl-ACP methyl ester carboxylesterase
MRAALKKGLLILGIAVLLGFSVDVFLRFAGPRRLRFTYLTGVLGYSEYEAMASQPGWASTKVEVAPGVSLNGLVRRPSRPDAPWLLYYPGNDAAQLRSGQDFLTRLAQSEDWGLATFSYRGYDGSGGEPRLAAMAQDAPVILRSLCQAEHIPRDRLHVLGFSIGGHFSVHAVAAAARDNAAVASLTLLNPVNDIVMLRRSRFQRLAPGDDFQTAPLLAGVPAPVLIVQGGADEALQGNTQGMAISRALGSRATYAELPGVGHQELLEQEPMFEKVRAFLTQRMGQGAQP